MPYRKYIAISKLYIQMIRRFYTEYKDIDEKNSGSTACFLNDDIKYVVNEPAMVLELTMISMMINLN